MGSAYRLKALTRHLLFCAGRLESFFGPVKVVSSGNKRKEPAPAKKGPPKKGKLGGVGGSKK